MRVSVLTFLHLQHFYVFLKTPSIRGIEFFLMLVKVLLNACKFFIVIKNNPCVANTNLLVR